MPTLQQHLLALPAHDVRAIATRLAVRKRSHRNKQAWSLAIAQAWQAPTHAATWLIALSPQAQAALDRLLQGDELPAPLFLAEFGGIRRAAKRQAWPIPPWQAPATPAEELYYLGLLCPINGSSFVKASAWDLPSDLRPRLHAMRTAALPPKPTSIRTGPDITITYALCHDVGQWLIYLHEQTLQTGQTPLRPPHRWLARRHLNHLNQRLWQAETPLPRTHKQSARLRLLHFLATAAGLVTAGALTPLAWAWLGEPPAQQLAQLWRGWLAASAELRQAYSQPDAALPAPWPTLLVSALNALPTPFTLPQLTAHLLAGAQTAYWVAQLATLTDLDQLLAALLTEVLAPLGVVALADGAPDLLALTPTGHWLLESGPQPPTLAPWAQPPARLDQQSGGWVVTLPAHALLAQAQVAPYAAYQVGERQPMPTHLYHLTPATIGRVAALGLGLPTLAAALAATGCPLPPAAWADLTAWHTAGQAVQLGYYPVLRTNDRALMQTLQQNAAVRAHCAELLSPTTLLLTTDLSTMQQVLQAAGCYAALPTGAPAAAPPTANGALWLAGQVYALLGQYLPLPLPPPFAALQTLFQQLPAAEQALLQSQLAHWQNQLLDLLDNLSFTPPPHPSDPDQWRAALEAACQAHTAVQLTYFSAGRNLLTQRMVEPYWLEERNQVPYLIAYCSQTGRVLTFRLDRIQAVRSEE
ncbi:MAG: WYL domain-containing protein [Caldilineaceae bacterium]